ncbi:MAG: hypothetical protein ACO22U_17015 [bacterium]
MKLTSNQENALKTIRRSMIDGIGRTTDIRAAKGLERKGLIRILTQDGDNVSDLRGIAGNRVGTKCARCVILSVES